MFKITVVDDKGKKQDFSADVFLLITKSNDQVSHTLAPDDTVLAFGLMEQVKTAMHGQILNQLMKTK